MRRKRREWPPRGITLLCVRNTALYIECKNSNRLYLETEDDILLSTQTASAGNEYEKLIKFILGKFSPKRY